MEVTTKRGVAFKPRCSILATLAAFAIPRIALQTAAIVVSELGSPDRFESAPQAAAYAGLVPRHHQSGTSVQGNPRMSKVSNERLLRAMYFPAMTALRFNSAVKALGDRLKERGKETTVVIGAAMRKLFHICYGVPGSGRPFDAPLQTPDTDQNPDPKYPKHLSKREGDPSAGNSARH